MPSSALPVLEAPVDRDIVQDLLDARDMDLPRKLGRRVPAGRKRACQNHSLIRASLKENAPMDLLSPALYRMVKRLGLGRINPEEVDVRLNILK